MLNISNIKPNIKFYNGKYKKFGITLYDEDYIVKLGQSQAYTEFIASEFIRSLAVPCHEVKLALYNGETVALVKDFVSGTKYTLHTYRDILQRIEDTEENEDLYDFDEIISIIGEKYEPQFWDMFICDCIIGNNDRHRANWGFLSNGKEQVFAPLYDNAGGLFPKADLEQYRNPETRKEFLYSLVYEKPKSSIKLKSEYRFDRFTFQECIKALSNNEKFNSRLDYFKQYISWEFVFNIMISICRRTDLDFEHIRFYTEIITLRYMCLLLKSSFTRSYNKLEKELKNYE